MPTIAAIRPVLLSAPYADHEGSAEVRLHLPSGCRTTGLVEITLDDGTAGLGEGYLAVFAPRVFVEIVELVAPVLVGRPLEPIAALVRDVEIVTGYWSFQGAARHVVSAVEIALQDLRAKRAGVPLWQALGGAADPIAMPAYASGGDSVDMAHMHREFDAVRELGITVFKIRARKHQAAKAVWCARAAADLRIAVDMAQNLAIPSQTAADTRAFVAAHDEAGVRRPAFLEEVQGPLAVEELPGLRRELGVPLAGGEIVTTPHELCGRVAAGCYDIVQPDATVIGGVGPTQEVFAAARAAGTQVFVHCWGAGVGMLANYHVAAAMGGDMVEWPLPAYALREALFAAQVGVVDGRLKLGEAPGLGARLTPEIERAFPFREDAVYRCLANASTLPPDRWP